MKVIKSYLISLYFTILQWSLELNGEGRRAEIEVISYNDFMLK